MWEKIKKGAAVVGGILAAIGAFLLGRNLRDNKNRDGQTEEHLANAEGAVADAEAAAGAIGHTVESIESGTDSIEQCTDECLSILDNIEKRGTKTKA